MEDVIKPYWIVQQFTVFHEIIVSPINSMNTKMCSTIKFQLKKLLITDHR